MLFINKLFNSIACLLSFTNLQLVIPGRTWILLYLGRTMYKRLWAYLALYKVERTPHFARVSEVRPIETPNCAQKVPSGQKGRVDVQVLPSKGYGFLFPQS